MGGRNAPAKILLTTLDFARNLRYSTNVGTCTSYSRSGMKEVMPMSSKRMGVTAGEAR